METFTDSGIDYGRGKTNIDADTGIRYGVIHNNRLGEFAWSEIQARGVDVDYEDAREELLSSLAHAVKSVLEDYSTHFDAKEIAEDIADGLDIEYQNTGDCTRYHYEEDGEMAVTFDVASDGDIFITHSAFYALCSFCSPCAPGAGSLESPGGVKAYCLGPDWFNKGEMPYKCFRVSDDSEVTE
jgi:hypothetical protein